MNMKKKIILCLGLFLILILFGLGWINFKKHKFQVVFLNIGQGDASLIQFSDGTVMLIDCGPDKVVLSKLGKYLPFYNRTIDYLLITHFDLDHYGGCVDVLKRYRVKNIISNGEQKNSDKYWLEWNKFKNQEQAKEIIINSQTNWQIAETVLEFLSPHPSLKLPTDANNRSIVFKLIKKDLTILFTGDIEAKAEKVLLEFYCEIKAIACATL